MLSLILVGCLTVLWTYFLWSRRKYYLLALKMPGEWGLPIVGIGHKIYKREDVLYQFPKLASKYKAKTFLFWFGPNPFIYTKDPKVADKVLNSPACINKSIFYDAIDEAFGGGILTSKSEEWIVHRKLIRPCFSHNISVSFIPLFNKLSQGLCSKLEALVNCGEVNVKELVLETTMQSSLATIMGLDEGHESTVGLFKQHFEKILAIVARKSLEPWLSIPTVFEATTMYRILVNSVHTLRSFLHKLAISKIKELEDRCVENSESYQGSVDERRTSYVFLDRALNFYQKKELTLKEVATETTVILVAAYETTATTMHSVLTFLAMHPQCQEKVFEEILSVFPHEDCEINHVDLKYLLYLDMCINESMRVAQSIPLIARKASSDIRLSEDLVIPRGVDIMVDIFNMHRDEDTWGPNARQFDPDNFLPENLVNKDKNSLMPFSIGPRNCIGWQYANVIMKIILSKVLRKYRFSTKYRFEDLHFVTNMTLKLKVLPFLEIHRRF